MGAPLIVTNELLSYLETAPEEEQNRWLFLAPSPDFKGYWQLDGLDNGFFFDFEDLVGPYRLVSAANIGAVRQLAETYNYEMGFLEDPRAMLEAYERLQAPPEIALNSNLSHTTNGFLPWQITGYNKLVADPSIEAGLFVWATGSGKSAAMTAAILHHLQKQDADLACCIVKSHNKIDTQRKLKSLGGLDSWIVDGTKAQRQKIYDQALALRGREFVALIFNYEKIREDWQSLQALTDDARVLFFWDEAPTKLSNRSTRLYKAAKHWLYDGRKPRTAWARHWALTATPIENSPEDIYNVVNLMRPGTLGTIKDFYDKYVSATNFFSGRPEVWHNLESLEARLQYMTHRVSKDDPDVAALFPEVMDRPITIDWHSKHLAIYNKLTGRVQDLVDQLQDVNLLALIQIMQMMCDAPSMIQQSAKNREAFDAMMQGLDVDSDWSGAKGSDIALMLIDQLGLDNLTDDKHTKLETWLDIIVAKHPDEKVITHSTWAEYIFPIWEAKLTQAGISYVVYRGSGKEKQQALDAFRNDPDIRCFLSGDAGADSIDIAEAAVGINYNVPWKWTTLQQRQGRRDRVNSEHKRIYTYTLTMPFSVDERKLYICSRKYDYHAQLFDGKANEEALTARLSKEELMYMLLGHDQSM